MLWYVAYLWENSGRINCNLRHRTNSWRTCRRHHVRAGVILSILRLRQRNLRGVRLVQAIATTLELISRPEERLRVVHAKDVHQERPPVLVSCNLLGNYSRRWKGEWYDLP